MEKPLFPMRINKYLALKKYSTRKGADELIKVGKVRINSRPAVLGMLVTEKDTVEVIVKTPSYQYFAYNKPKNIITHSPQKSEEDIKGSVDLSGVFPIGRLDKKSHGLILLTNDGRITDRLLNPKNAHAREYEVETYEDLKQGFKEKMERGVLIEGYRTQKCNVEIKERNLFSITLTEGKKHQIRRMCAALGYTVSDLKRVKIMDIELGGLKPGEYREIKGSEKTSLLKNLAL